MAAARFGFLLNEVIFLMFLLHKSLGVPRTERPWEVSFGVPFIETAATTAHKHRAQKHARQPKTQT